jgi:hypothetical protein
VNIHVVCITFQKIVNVEKVFDGGKR